MYPLSEVRILNVRNLVDQLSTNFDDGGGGDDDGDDDSGCRVFS